jgi:hypothetical protein
MECAICTIDQLFLFPRFSVKSLSVHLLYCLQRYRAQYTVGNAQLLEGAEIQLGRLRDSDKLKLFQDLGEKSDNEIT